MKIEMADGCWLMGMGSRMGNFAVDSDPRQELITRYQPEDLVCSMF